MIILLAFVLFLWLLQSWVTGHWLARVLVFLGGIPVFWLLTCSLLDNYVMRHTNELLTIIFGTMIGLHLAWQFASLPAYVQRWRARPVKHLAKSPGEYA